MTLPALPLQKAVRDALVGPLTALGCKVYDAVPDNAPMPFVHIGDDQIVGDSEHGEWFDCTVNVHAFARDKDNPGKVKLKQIVNAIYAALNTQLAVSGFECMTARPFRDTIFLTEVDGKTEHAIVTFDYLLQPL